MTTFEKHVTSPFPWDFLEAIDPDLIDLEGIPLTSTPKGFSFDRFEKLLAQKFKLEGVKVEIMDPIPFEGLTDQEKYDSFSVPGIGGTLALILSKAELQGLLLHLFQKNREGSVEEDYLDPFWNFLKTNLKGVFLSSFEGNPPLPLEERGEIAPTIPGLKFSLAFTIGQEKFFGALYASKDFTVEWRRSNLKSVKRGVLGTLLSKRVEMALDLVVGAVELPKPDWNNLERGDTILLDQLTYPPQAEKGEGLLFFGETPLYRVKIKQGAIKIQAAAGGVKIFMPIEPQATPQAVPHPKSEEKELLDDPQNDDHEGLNDELSADGGEIKVSRGAPVSLNDLPLQIRIEMGRFKLPLHEVLALQEGNILKIDVDPRKGVDLVVEGKVIGRGELVKIGDLVGVRITDLQ